MIGRDALLTFAALTLLILSGLAFTGVTGTVPPIVVAFVIVAILFERRNYFRATSGRPGPQWQLTGESFVDRDTGHIVRIWLDPESGARREVRTEPPLN